MTAFARQSAEDQARLETAANWRVRLRQDPTLELSAEFVAWVQDAGNSRAFKAVEEGWWAIEDLGAAPEILDMRRSALARTRNTGAQRWWSRSFLVQAVAAAVIMALLGGGAFYAIWHDRTVYLTDIGERRIVALPDGSRISMDSDSRIRVHYSDSGRAIDLDRGRARFDVTHDIARPFTVSADGETVVAVGTSFDVERLADKVLVTLIQGDVVIKSEDTTSALPAAPVPQISLNAGQQFVAIKHFKPKVQPVNLQTATAWESGQLVFRDETLAEAVIRVNRYTEHAIEVDSSVAALRVSGVFNAGDVGAFVSAVAHYLKIQATTTSDDHILLQSRS